MIKQRLLLRRYGELLEVDDPELLVHADLNESTLSFSAILQLQVHTLVKLQQTLK